MTPAPAPPALTTSVPAGAFLAGTGETVGAVFRRYDADGGGTIDRDELRAAINREREKPLEEKQLTALMNFADSDGNGEIDFEEYKQIMTYSSGM